MRVDLLAVILRMQAILMLQQQHRNRAHLQAGTVGNERRAVDEPARRAEVGRQLDGLLEEHGCELSAIRFANTGHRCLHAGASFCFGDAAGGGDQACLRNYNYPKVVEVSAETRLS